MTNNNIKRKNWLKKRVRTKKSLGVLGKYPLYPTLITRVSLTKIQPTCNRSHGDLEEIKKVRHIK